MTLHVADIASYQQGLTLAAVRAAGFGAVNVKISHGMGVRSVHPQAADWIAGARAAGMGVSTFHYLDNSASGVDQANWAYACMVELGALDGTAHQVDCESTATEQILVDYLAVMQRLLRRPVVVYTGDWWWRPRNWHVADLTPYVWAAPNAGYLPSYPGDDSPHWACGYGGWTDLAVMQYRVAPVAGVRVSQSAIRDLSVWHDLTTVREANAMTVAPAALKAARLFLLEHLPLDPLAVGIVGDDNHNRTGSSYHLGASALRSDAYSVTESPRDRAGLSEDASALDLGWFEVTVKGKRHTLRSYSIWLVAQCKAGAADTLDLREVIYSPDGETVKRWDRLGIRFTGESSHTGHTHHSYFRDSAKRDKTALFRRYLTEIGLLEGDDMNGAEMLALLKSTEGKAAIYDAVNQDRVRRYGADGKPVPVDPAHPGDENMTWASALSFMNRDTAQIKAALAALAARDDTDESAIVAGVLAGLDAETIAAAIPAELATQVADQLAARLQA